MLNDDDLRRLGQWKQGRRTTFAIGELLGEQLGSHALKDAVVLQEIRSALEPVLDDAFQRYCVVAGYRKGRVTVHVNNPAAVASMRRKYLFVLRERLQDALPKAHVRDIHFAVVA